LDFLNRIAAICAPIMKANHLAIMSLEEYEPNLEFVGRNFNAGEVIQLVLKTPYTGYWLPFRHVQMVMMHELAHCKQMNHSGAFWKVRNQYSDELRELWKKDYTGDGMWGRGRLLASGEQSMQADLLTETLPASLCGGTYRSARRKRKRGGALEQPKISYAERQQKRIVRKFGTNGLALGDDENTRVKLENGKKPKGKPRVAGSARGRELRAAAALARFGQKKEEEVKSEADSDSETESDEDMVNVKTEAVDIDGKKMTDGHGHGLVKVCEDEDVKDEDVKREMEELREAGEGQAIKEERPETGTEIENGFEDSHRVSTSNPSRTSKYNTKGPRLEDDIKSDSSSHPLSELVCPVCSFSNSPSTLTCTACSNVVDTVQVPDHWRCKSLACQGGEYINAGDCGICGVCGTRKLD
jgi:hypothetical protein